jgi:WD40 repeat protein
MPAQVLRIADDGTQSISLDGLRDTIDSIAFGPDAELYVATRDTTGNHLYYLSQPDEELVEIPGAPQGRRLDLSVHPVRQTLFIAQKDGLPILEFNLDGQVAVYNFGAWSETRIDFASDGTLFAYGSSGTDYVMGYTDRWIYRMDLDTVETEIIASIPRAEPGGTINTLSVDSQGVIWFYTNPDGKLYRILPDGTIDLFAEHLPIDAPTIVVDDQGDVYFTCASGVFRIYREP